ncbi:MAG: J domain-containing protein [Halobacteriovoraceae bacterium]|jgi:DnaJ-domain-containing protein 1|nr:J domain-containing protein [Halobacteriovoraceae bacterium]
MSIGKRIKNIIHGKVHTILNDNESVDFDSELESKFDEIQSEPKKISEIDSDKKKALHILELSDQCSLNQIKSAYRNLSKKYHPDNFSNESKKLADASKLMGQINWAYEYLLKKEK